MTNESSVVRPIRDTDHAAALALLKNGVGHRGNRIFVSDDGKGAVIWRKPLHGIALLGAVATARPNRRLFYELIRACCQDAISTGLERAEFTVHDRRIVSLIERDFNAVGVVEGRNGDTQEPASWRFEVDLKDALRQLDEKLA